MNKMVLKLRGISFDTVSRSFSIPFDNVSDLGSITPNLNDLRQAVSQATAMLAIFAPESGPLCHLNELKRSIDSRETVFRTFVHVDDLPLSEQHFLVLAAVMGLPAGAQYHFRHGRRDD